MSSLVVCDGHIFPHHAMTEKDPKNDKEIDQLFSELQLPPGLPISNELLRSKLHNILRYPSQQQRKGKYPTAAGQVETLEKIIALAGDMPAEVIHDPNAVIDQLANNLVNQWKAEERVRIEADIVRLDAELKTLQPPLDAAIAKKNAWVTDGPYGRSIFDATDNLGSISRTKVNNYKLAMPDHKKVITDFLTRAGRVVDLERQLEPTEAKSSQAALQKEIDRYFVLNSANLITYQLGKKFRDLGMPFSKNSADYVVEMRIQRSAENVLTNDVNLAQMKVTNTQNAKKAKQDQLTSGNIDMTRVGILIDGSTPEERATWDKALEQYLSETYGTPVTIDLTPQIPGDRAVKTNGAWSIQLTEDELVTDIAQKIADIVKVAGTDSSLADKIESALNSSLLRTSAEDIADTEQREATAAALSAEVSAVLQSFELEAEPPIEPNLSVVKITGPNVFVALQSPADVSHIVCGPGGLLCHQQLTHEGGTTFDMAMVTFDITQATGFYKLSLYDADWNEIDVVFLFWDKDSKTLSLQYSSDQFSGSTPEGGDAMSSDDAAVFEKILNINTTYLSDIQIDRIQQIRLYEKTAELPAPYNFYIGGGAELMTYIHAVHPEYRPENWDAAIYKLWKERYSTYPLGKAEDEFHYQRLAFENDMRDKLGVYEQAMGQIMQKSVDIFLRLRQGYREVDLLNQLNDLMTQWNANRDIQIIGGQLGIRIPSRQIILEAARMVLDISWEEMIRREADVATAMQRADYLREAILWQNAIGDWLAVSESNDASDIPPEMDRRQISLSTKINQALKNSTNPKIVAYNQILKDKLTLKVAASLPENPDDALIAYATLVAMNEIDTEFGVGVNTYKVVVRPEFIGSQYVTILPNGSAQLTIDLKQDSMVNLWVEPGVGNTTPAAYDLSLLLKGHQLPTNGYLSDKQDSRAGESVSTVLPAGVYTLILRDNTNYVDARKIVPSFTPTERTLPIGINIQSYDTRHIQGRISIEQSNLTMPVSLRVAEFDTSGDRENDINTLNSLDSSKPVWVIVHGMNSSDKDSIMEELAKSLYNYSKNESIQVVTINWEEAAKWGSIPTQDAPWAVAVGQWGARQLVAAGFPAEKINLGGWSHGSYVAFEMAKEIQRMAGSQINALVALDAANNIPFISGYDHNLVNFSSVSQQALAIDSSIIAGSDTLAKTADISFSINSIELNPSIRHKLAVTAFTEILNHERDTSGGFSQYFSLQKLMNGVNTDEISLDVFDGVFEGIIDVGVDEVMESDGTYYKATPNVLRIRKKGSNVDELIYFHSANV